MRNTFKNTQKCFKDFRSPKKVEKHTKTGLFEANVFNVETCGGGGGGGFNI